MVNGAQRRSKMPAISHPFILIKLIDMHGMTEKQIISPIIHYNNLIHEVRLGTLNCQHFFFGELQIES